MNQQGFHMTKDDSQVPGDSIRDLFIPDRWRSRLQPLSSGHFF